MSRPLLLLPTYNESQNLPGFIPEVLAAFPADILIIDDNSPDGTGRIADELARQNSRISVMHRPKKSGLGSAYVAGFRWALERSYDAVFQMDSDFSHDPKDLPRLAEALSGCDMALGSRYVKGGRILDWPWPRLAISALGNYYARAVLRIGVKDLTGGFKAFKREALQALDLDRIFSDGYAFQIETTYRTVRKGFKVKEIPIVFRDRTLGESKISRRVVWEALGLVWKLLLL